MYPLALYLFTPPFNEAQDHVGRAYRLCLLVGYSCSSLSRDSSNVYHRRSVARQSSHKLAQFRVPIWILGFESFWKWLYVCSLGRSTSSCCRVRVTFPICPSAKQPCRYPVTTSAEGFFEITGCSLRNRLNPLFRDPVSALRRSPCALPKICLFCYNTESVGTAHAPGKSPSFFKSRLSRTDQILDR
jgi:hypothetical protein